MQVLWPGFLGAVLSVGVLFSLVDPVDMPVVERVLSGNRLAAYTVGFLLFWFTTTVACVLTWSLATAE